MLDRTLLVIRLCNKMAKFTVKKLGMRYEDDDRYCLD